jgi:hypothetical protein
MLKLAFNQAKPQKMRIKIEKFLSFIRVVSLIREHTVYPKKKKIEK